MVTPLCMSVQNLTSVCLQTASRISSYLLKWGRGSRNRVMHSTSLAAVSAMVFKPPRTGLHSYYVRFSAPSSLLLVHRGALRCPQHPPRCQVASTHSLVDLFLPILRVSTILSRNPQGFCNEPSLASTWTLNATTRSILSQVPRTGLDCLTASKTSYSKNRIWNPVLCSQLTNKLTVDFKSFYLFLLVSMTDSYSKKESEHQSSLHCCVTMKTCI